MCPSPQIIGFQVLHFFFFTKGPPLFRRITTLSSPHLLREDLLPTPSSLSSPRRGWASPQRRGTTTQRDQMRKFGISAIVPAQILFFFNFNSNSLLGFVSFAKSLTWSRWAAAPQRCGRAQPPRFLRLNRRFHCASSFRTDLAAQPFAESSDYELRIRNARSSQRLKPFPKFPGGLRTFANTHLRCAQTPPENNTSDDSYGRTGTTFDTATINWVITRRKSHLINCWRYKGR